MICVSFFLCLYLPTSVSGGNYQDQTKPFPKSDIQDQTQKGMKDCRRVSSEDRSGEEITKQIVEQASQVFGRLVMVKIIQKKQVADWMFLVGEPQEVDGQPLDYSSTAFASQYTEGLVDNVCMALAQKTYGTWELKAFSLGATDAPFFDWSEKFGLPLSLFSFEEK
jgi:hypothetical protein